MGKEDVVHIYNSIISLKKKKKERENEIMPFAAIRMGLEIILTSEVRERQILYDTTCMQNL